MLFFVQLTYLANVGVVLPVSIQCLTFEFLFAFEPKILGASKSGYFSKRGFTTEGTLLLLIEIFWIWFSNAFAVQ